MDTPSNYTLLKLSDTDLDLRDSMQDVRGRKAVDSNGHDLGHIDELFIDDTEKKVRFIRVESGGILGIGGQKFLIPVDAITRINNDEVRIDRTKDHVAASPAYDPELADVKYADRLYEYYGYMPFWGVGYIYPSYPFYL